MYFRLHDCISVYMIVHLYTWLLCLYDCTSGYMIVCLSTWLYICQHDGTSVYMIVYLCTWLYICVHDCTSVYIVHMFIWVYFSLHDCISVYMIVLQSTWLYFSLHDYTSASMLAYSYACVFLLDENIRKSELLIWLCGTSFLRFWPSVYRLPWGSDVLAAQSAVVSAIFLHVAEPWTTRRGTWQTLLVM